MAKKDWKKHFLRMKQLANQNLGRYAVEKASFNILLTAQLYVFWYCC